MEIKIVGSNLPLPPKGPHRGGPPPPQDPKEDGDFLEISSEASMKFSGVVPDELKSSFSDLQGGQQNLIQDLQTIGRYFEQQPGGRRALDAYMEANFSGDQLDEFRKALQASGPPPPGGR